MKYNTVVTEHLRLGEFLYEPSETNNTCSCTRIEETFTSGAVHRVKGIFSGVFLILMFSFSLYSFLSNLFVHAMLYVLNIFIVDAFCNDRTPEQKSIYPGDLKTRQSTGTSCGKAVFRSKLLNSSQNIIYFVSKYPVT